MGVDFYRQRVRDGHFDLVHVCAQSDYREIWKPVCEDLGLRLALVAIDFTDLGALPEELKQLVAELSSLRDWLEVNSQFHPRCAYLRENLDRVIWLIRDTPLDQYEIGFA